MLHVNDVAGVASAAVQQATRQGLDWRLWPLPPIRGAALPAKIARRARDLARFRAAGRAAGLLHVHYGLFGYYAWTVRRPYLLHLHGTDVRGNLASPALRPLVLRAIRRAGAVAYSTPDLAAAVTALRPDAAWLPAPLPPALCDAAEPRSPSGPPTRPMVVFASRWDPIKGLDVLLRTAARLRRERPDLDLVGVDWGTGADLAGAAGVRLLPLLPATEFHQVLAGADVVVGAQSGDLVTLSDLQAMALARPLVMRYTAGAAYGDAPDVWNTAEQDPVHAVLDALADPDGAARRARRSRDWALRHHHPRRFVQRCLELYDAVPGC